MCFAGQVEREKEFLRACLERATGVYGDVSATLSTNQGTCVIHMWLSMALGINRQRGRQSKPDKVEK